MSKTYIFRGITYRNLTPLCHSCHEEVYGYREADKEEPITKERC